MQGETTTLRPRLVVGADGRHGKTAEQIGATLQQDEPHHRFSGMLIDNVPEWREDTQFISTEGDVNVLAFPQGGGRIRLYIGFALEQKTRLAGRARSATIPRRVSPEIGAGQRRDCGRAADRSVPRLSEQRHVDRRSRSPMACC